MHYLVTGGCGFIGSHFVRLLFEAEPGAEVTNIDLLTYAGSEGNVADVAAVQGGRYRFVRDDIADAAAMRRVFESGPFDAVVNLAAESHVDRSIADPGSFVRTNVVGTANLLELAREFGVARFVQVSTDEVYGSLADDGPPFTETTPLDPSSPYSASKAGGDLLALAAHRTYGQEVIVTRCSNNYGPRQFPEKLIPVMISKALADEPPAGLRRRQERPGLDLRRRPLPGDPRRAARRGGGGGLQFRGRLRADEPPDCGGGSSTNSASRAPSSALWRTGRGTTGATRSTPPRRPPSSGGRRYRISRAG